MNTSPNPQVTSLVEEIGKAGKSYSQNEQGARDKLLSLAYSLATAVELPSETIQRIGWAEPARFASTKIAVDLNLFEILKEKKDAGVTTEELATASKADPKLISRTMKHLTATNMVGELSTDHYIATPLSTALTEPKYRDGITYLHDVALPSFQKIPAYLKSISYAHPTNIASGPFQYAHSTKNPFFIWLASYPPLASCFNNYMGGYRAGKTSWVDPGFYPVEERLGAGLKNDGNGEGEGVLMVDVGGGIGHDLEELRAKWPDVKGRLILQDQASVIESVTGEKEKGFEKMAHDFFGEQPVKGARSYHLHSILHDWDDDSCISILRSLIPALTPSYSKILINELVVPDKGAHWSVTSMDWLMLALGAVKERTERDWRNIVERSGLRVSGIWEMGVGNEGLIECELA